MRARTKIVALGIVIGCVACADLQQKQWYQTTREVTTTTISKVSGATSKVASRMQDYLARKEVLEKFHDAGEHSEDALLKVLRGAGVGKSTTAANKKPADVKPAGGGASTRPAGDSSATKNTGKVATAAGQSKFPENYKGSYRWPLDAGIVSSEYGERWGKMHKGLDIAADVGEPVYAAAAGEVIYASNGMRGYGNAVIVRHDDRATSLYAHNSELKVKAGQKVTQGELIALLGNTGHSTGPHVHFEIRSGDAPVNPRGLLPKSMNAVVLPEPLVLDRNQLFAGVLSAMDAHAELELIANLDAHSNHVIPAQAGIQ
jgi:murein DD-endopeptidase MepM/ murein hydrolase activator NlpD